MLLLDIPTIVQHGCDWSISRAFGSKWMQKEAVPQGSNYAVGLVNLIFQMNEHETYERDPSLKEKFHRARWLDDGVS